MKRMLALFFGITMLMAAFAVTSASAQPGPNGSNEKGLCTAYFNGQKKGHDKNNDGRSDPPPFAALEDAADPDQEHTGEDLASAVYNWCNQYGIEGNGNENGRWDCSEQDDDGNFVCTEN